ncbi:MAG: hypothetical protein AAGL24_28030 [Pseudomonadota bacterium]
MATIAALDGGTYYHHRTLYEDRYRGFFDHIIYAPAIAAHDLEQFDVVIVSCRTDPVVLIPAKDQFRSFLDAGGTLVAMGSTGQQDWLPNVVWHDTPTNFWWWREGGSLGLRPRTPDHPLFAHLTMDDATWHYHGFFDPPSGACSLIDVADKGSILYDDMVSTPGRMLVTSLDPMYHHGSYFMPATTRFLDGFLPYLRRLPPSFDRSS